MAQHFVLTLGRSGSNTLVNVLNQHPGILNYGEVLGEWNRIRKIQHRLRLFRGDDARYLDTLLHNRLLARVLNAYRSASHRHRGTPGNAKAFSGIRTLGLKEFSLNLQRYGLTRYLEDRPHIKVIGLRRKDVLDRFVSNEMLVRTGVVAARTEEEARAEKIRIDPATLTDRLSAIAEENRVLDGMLAAIPPGRKIVVDYAEFYRDPERRRRITDALFAFLDLPPFEPEIRMRKIIQGPSVNRIENIDECRRAVQGTPFAPLFEPR